MIPVTHMSDITKDHSMLIYAIRKGKSIDVGSVIQQSILFYLRQLTTFHPSLITGLCCQFVFFWDKTEELLHPYAWDIKRSNQGIQDMALRHCSIDKAFHRSIFWTTTSTFHSLYVHGWSTKQFGAEHRRPVSTVGPSQSTIWLIYCISGGLQLCISSDVC